MKWFSNMKIGTKLIGGFVVVAVIAAMISLTGSRKIHQLDAADTMLYENMLLPLNDMAHISVSFQQIRFALRDLVEATDPQTKQKSINEIRYYQDDITKHSNEFVKSIRTDDERRLFNDFIESGKVYANHIEKLIELENKDRHEEATVLMHGAVREAAQQEHRIVEKLMESQAEQAKQTSENNTAIAHSASMTMAVLAVVGFVLSISLGLFISACITRPMSEAVFIANRIADGDLTMNVEAKSRDEIGQLMVAIKNMVGNMRAMVGQTVDISTGIASASSQLQSTAEQIATGAEEIAAQSNTVAAASEEMSATSIDIARNCALAADASKQTTDSATSGAMVVNETIAGMNSIAERVRETSLTIAALGTRSEQIGDIVGTIEDIADQTNLLALNAAIEAARAGEQGRGFAVVADEVRALAERTTKATREISEMIKAIQNETKAAVYAMDEGVREVEKGTVASRKSGQALEEILSRINEVTIQINQIATAAEEQTATTNEVTSNIMQVAEIVHQGAQGAEETANAASQLANQAQELQGLVGKFRLA